MARTFNNLWQDVVQFETLYRAWERTAKGRKRQRDVISFHANLEPNLIEIQESLIHKTYCTGPYHRFFVYDPKKREIASLPLKDRVVQHALVSVIEPIFEAQFIDQSFACREGRGAHKGADKVQQYLQDVNRRHGNVHVLKADISKYFPSVCHDVLKRIMARKITCQHTSWLIDAILDSAATGGSLMPRGIPIGNLTSQMFANIYLNELDGFVKHTLREPYYVRYMDDFVIVHHDKSHLHAQRQAIEDFLWAELGLRTNSKTQVFPVGDGGQAVDFLGYRIWPTHRALRKDSVHRMKRKMRRMQKLYMMGEITLDDIEPVITSWVGHAKHANTYNLRTKVLGGASFVPPPLRLARQPTRSTRTTHFKATAFAAQTEGAAARADMALLHQVLGMESTQRRLDQSPPAEDASDEEKATDAAERAAAQAVIDAASDEAKALYDRRNPPTVEPVAE